jgi:hypothetical protein
MSARSAPPAIAANGFVNVNRPSWQRASDSPYQQNQAISLLIDLSGITLLRTRR